MSSVKVINSNDIPRHKLSKIQIELVSGLAAGLSTTLVTHPLDVIKVRLQLLTESKSKKSYSSIITVLKRIQDDVNFTYSNRVNHFSKPTNYIIQFYRGVGANIIGNVSAWGVYFALYAEFKQRIRFKNENLPLNFFTSSVLAGLFTSLLTNPIWVLKTRILGSSRSDRKAYKSTFDGIATMLKTEGISSFWKGSIPSLFQVLQASLQFTFYDLIKHELLKNKYGYHHNDEKSAQKILSSWQYLYASALSKIASTILMYPTQVVKTRLQNNKTNGKIKNVVLQLYTKEGGISAFYKGLSANIIRVLPATCVTFVVYENAKAYLSC